MFENSLQKLARALDLQAHLLHLFQEYIGPENITLEAYTEGADMQFMSAVVKNPPPPYLSLIIGDTIHNLRSSLDYLTSELMRTKKSAAKTTFPMHETEGNLKDLMNNGVLGKEFPELIPIILDEIKPYDQKDVCLWNIGHFDNIDKHNLIVPTVSISRILGASFHTAHTAVVFATVEIGSGNKVVGFQSQSPGPFVITDPGKAQAALLFPEGKVLSRFNVIQSLEIMSSLTLETINIFGKTYDPDWTDKFFQYSEPGT